MENLVITGKIKEHETEVDTEKRSWMAFVEDNKDIFMDVGDRTRCRNMISNRFRHGTG
jgi:hypothetical protein